MQLFTITWPFITYVPSLFQPPFIMKVPTYLPIYVNTIFYRFFNQLNIFLSGLHLEFVIKI